MNWSVNARTTQQKERTIKTHIIYRYWSMRRVLYDDSDNDDEAGSSQTARLRSPMPVFVRLVEPS